MNSTLLSNCQRFIDEFSVIKQPTFTIEEENTICCSKFHDYSSLYHTQVTYDNSFAKVDQQFPMDLRKLVSKNDEDMFANIEYNLLTIYQIITYDAHEFTIFTSARIKNIWFVIDDYILTNSCGSCDGTTESHITLVIITNKSNLVDYLEYKLRERYFSYCQFPMFDQLESDDSENSEDSE
jgi:hypothetical protein